MNTLEETVYRQAHDIKEARGLAEKYREKYYRLMRVVALGMNVPEYEDDEPWNKFPWEEEKR